MAKITYNPKHPDDPKEVECFGKTFKAGEAVEFDGRKTEHKAFIESAEGNPWFEIDGKQKPEKKLSEPTTAEEYRAYAIDWINKVPSSVKMERRWEDERSMRDDLGWGSEDQNLIDPIFAPRLENLKNSENLG